MYVIKPPKSREDFKAYYDLRYKVLREPWGLPRGSEKDDYEPISQHFMVVDDQSGKPVGTAKLYEKEAGVAWLSHLSVEPSHQKKGVGKLLVAYLENQARQQGFKKIGCLSRLTTTSYFEKLGYVIAGLPMHYFGTTQVVWMEKTL
ncbi:MAG TPA: GNAT family N-acetyltransferase [Anaerolineaceae bacterium]|nr:GNAT family N-acetyltransferase [Anaerolineaceae bacterium]